MILYLMSKYSSREDASLEENRNARWALDIKGYTVLNPIEHSHYYAKWLHEKKLSEPNWIQQDLALLENIDPKQLVMIALDSAIPTINQYVNMMDSGKEYSQGVWEEFNWAVRSNILCISLKTALRYPEETWKQYCFFVLRDQE